MFEHGNRVRVSYWPRWWDNIVGRTGWVTANTDGRIVVRLDVYPNLRKLLETIVGTEENFERIDPC